MGLFRKNPTFKTVNIGLGSSRQPMYYKPTKKELNEIRGAGRLSITPHGSAISKVKVVPKKKRSRLEKAGEIASEFRSYEGKSAGEWVGDFGRSDSRSALDRNLSFRI